MKNRETCFLKLLDYARAKGMQPPPVRSVSLKGSAWPLVGDWPSDKGMATLRDALSREKISLWLARWAVDVRREQIAQAKKRS